MNGHSVIVHVFLILFLNLYIIRTEETAEHPRIFTEDGHLIFQSGTNHNISFRASEGGYINVQGVNVKETFLTIKNHETSIAAIEDLVQRVQTLETRVVNVIRTGEENHCGANPCMNGGTCVNTFHGYTCICPSNWQGVTCETDVNECDQQVCEHGGTCTNIDGSFRCECGANWEGTLCSVRYDACTHNLGNRCQHGECLNVYRNSRDEMGYICICDDGWKRTSTSDPSCGVDINECEAQNPPCSYDPEVTCTNLMGTFRCGNCPNGYRGNGFTCTDVDECLTSNGGCSLIPYVECINTRGSYRCGSCPRGYEGDGTTCSWVGFCRHNNGGCHPMATCTESQGDSDRTCICPNGYAGNGVGDQGCIRFAVCDTHNCQNGGNCTPLQNGSYSCICPSGFTGRYCETEIHTNPACGGNLTASSGVIRSPNYPGQYGNNESCIWIIRAQEYEYITVTFTNIDLPSDVSCNGDFVQINNGIQLESFLLGRFCGSVLPAPVISTSSSVRVTFQSDQSITAAGFQASWTVNCGGIYDALSGTIQSPGFPQLTQVNEECVYVIHQTEDYFINLEFTTFSVRSFRHECSKDFIEIRDGSSSTSPLIGIFCEDSQPPVVVSSGQFMWIKYHSLEYENSFRAVYTAVEGCGGNLQAGGTFSYPVHSGLYANNLNCTWTLGVDQGSIIDLSFNTLNTEGQEPCVQDYVEVFDSSAVSLGRFCGYHSNPIALTSSGNTLTVKFVTDHENGMEGFSATYTAVHLSDCGATMLIHHSGYVTSPNHPGNYIENKVCTWTIVVRETEHIQLKILEFDLENSVNCTKDYLEIRSGFDSEAYLNGKFCGSNITSPIVSNANSLYIKFRSDDTFTSSGFKLYYSILIDVCRELIRSDEGGVISPNYPAFETAECAIRIEVKYGYHISIKFEDFSVAEGAQQNTCTSEYMLVLDTDSILVTYCGGPEVAQPIITSTNIIYIKYVAFPGRFHFDYKSVCGMYYRDNTGVIQSPDYPDFYPANSTCDNIIETTLGNTITLTFKNVDIGELSYCSSNYLEIRDGNNSNSSLMYRLCGTHMPEPITSTGNAVWIRFVSGSVTTGSGFQLRYVMNKCRADLIRDIGTITSPGYPNPVPKTSGRECEWLIAVNPAKSIELNISDFDIESRSNCSTNVLQIYSGSDTRAAMVAEICHKQVSPVIVTSGGNYMLLKYNSDGIVTGRGFTASYRTIMGGCGGNFVGESGVIMSKNYPRNFPHNVDCHWLITVASGSTVVLTFESFQMEYSDPCQFDYVQVLDGDSVNSPELLKACGFSSPDPNVYQSSSNVMLVRMVTDASTASRGFKAVYNTGCGGEIRLGQDGSITSPNYPRDYNPNQNCTWHLHASGSSEHVSLIFTHLDVVSDEGCDNDYVSVLNGDSISSPEIGRYCGNSIPPPVVSEGSDLTVQFVSDGSLHGSGFRATYSKLATGCGGVFRSSRGALSITSPDSTAYPPNIECVWLILVPPGSRVQLSFSMFDLEPDPTCNKDYVEIKEGDGNWTLLGRFCGISLPTALTSNVDLWLKFRSDSSNEARGFIANYIIVPGGYYTGTSGQIATPGYPHFYPHNSDVNWRVEVPENKKVRVEFIYMDIEGTLDCSYDFVRLQDSFSNEWSEPYCGINIPPVYYASSSHIYINFQSDAVSRGRGFLLNWTAVDESPPANTTTECGGVIYVNESTLALTSPGYPTSYMNNLDCVWEIISDSGTRIQLSINFFDIEGQPQNCILDKVTVYPYSSIDDNPLAVLCGHIDTVNPILSASNKMTVRFTTDPTGVRFGFSLNITTVCGGDIIATSGHISSPDTPDHSYQNQTCRWTIIVPSGRTIRIRHFRHFDIPVSTNNCSQSYIMLRNGGSSTSPPLGNQTDGKYCGTTFPSQLLTSSNQAFVEFFSTSMAPYASRFTLHFSQVEVTCGRTITFSADFPGDSIHSPNYPNVYPHDVECVWKISAPYPHRVRLIFRNFNIQQNNLCMTDFLEIRDGIREDSLLLAKYCGNQNPHSISSSSRYMFIRFRSGSKGNTTSGFQIHVGSASCGGTINGDSGVITSPGYPSRYRYALTCEWFVNGPRGHFLTFTITDFQLEYSNSCVADFLEIRELNSTGQRLLHSCGQVSPLPVNTSDSFGFVKYVSDGNGPWNSLSLIVTSSIEECGGDLRTPTGVIASPNYPGLYPHSRICDWRITVQPDRRVTLTFDNFGITTTDCAGDHVIVYDGTLDSSPYINEYCGSNMPTVVQSSGGRMRIVFQTDADEDDNLGFRATYTSNNEAVCGGELSAGNNTVTSPGYGTGSYPIKTECIWTVHDQNLQNSYVFLFDYLDLEYHATCIFDFIEIREGDNENGDLVGVFCGNSTYNMVPGPILSLGPNLWIRFKSDGADVGSGFSLRYISGGCGGRITGESGNISSPNYPNSYGRNTYCLWHIDAPEGNQILIQITEFSTLSNTHCLSNYLEIQNGGYPDSPSIGKFCGDEHPPSFRSGDNAVRIALYASKANAITFRLTYLFRSRGCGGLHHGKTGSITSPNYPHSYPDNTECIWSVVAPRDFHVALSFNPNFDIEVDSTCSLDYVELSDVVAGEEKLIDRWCSNLAPQSHSSLTSTLKVKFHSDASINGNGFEMNWQAVCGRTYFEDQGILTSPNYPNNYDINLDCYYTIIVPTQKVMALVFYRREFELEGVYEDCPFDYVAFYRGNDTTGEYLGKFCGTSPPYGQIKFQGSLFIHFHSDEQATYKGFRAVFKSKDCGGVYTDPAGIVSSPQLDTSRFYHRHADCTWLIRVQEDRIVYLRFQEFDIEPHEHCSKDYIEIHDGNSTSSPLIGRFCGNVLPHMLQTTTNMAFIHLVSDASGEASGFKIAYETRFACGGFLNGAEGNISFVSANDDELYENLMDCMWVISGLEDNVIQLTFEFMDIEIGDVNCEYDYLKVYNSFIMREDTLVGSYCGTDLPSPIQSALNVLTLVFHSDEGYAERGFNASYRQIPVNGDIQLRDIQLSGFHCLSSFDKVKLDWQFDESGCQALTNAPCRKTLTATHNPQTFFMERDLEIIPNLQFMMCHWLITASQEIERINITVVAFNLTESSHCREEYLEFRDYPLMINGQTPVYYCGETNPPVWTSTSYQAVVNLRVLQDRPHVMNITYQVAGCDRTYTGDSGSVNSAGWPFNYGNLENCAIYISSSIGTRLSLFFNSIDIELDPECRIDYLQIFDGASINVNSLGKYCGNTIPDPIYASGNDVSMRFISDAITTFPGYSITYIASTSDIVGCGGVVNAREGRFTSPGYPTAMNVNVTCDWLIVSPRRYTLTLDLKSLDLVGTQNCDHNYVGLYDGREVTSPLLGRYCGDELVASRLTTGNMALVRLASDGVNAVPNFQLQFSSSLTEL